jgi:hypothetical protein
VIFSEKAIANMRHAVRVYPNKAELARMVGLKQRKSLYDFIEGSMPLAETLSALIDVLQLDPETGLPKQKPPPGKRIVRVIKTGKVQPESQTEGLRVLNDHESTTEETSDLEEITDEEFELIKAARKWPAQPSAELQRLRVRIQASLLGNGQKEAMIKIIDKEYIAALQIIVRMLEKP